MAKNDIDRIVKENLIVHLLDVFKAMLGIVDCEIDTKTKVPPLKMHRTVEREADLLTVMRRPGGERFILHVEFQTANDKEMLFRIQEYHALIQRKLNLPIHHHVVYLGRHKPNMLTDMNHKMRFDGFMLHNVSEFNSEVLIESQVPEEIIMAILGNFAGQEPVKVIEKLLKRLKEVSTDEVKLKKYIYQLTILSRLRNLQKEIIQYTESMALTIDIEKDILYKRGIRKGMEKGMEKGMKASRRKMAQNMKREGLDIELIAKITDLPVSEISKL